MSTRTGHAYAYCVRVLRTRTRTRTEKRADGEEEKHEWQVCWAHTRKEEKRNPTQQHE